MDGYLNGDVCFVYIYNWVDVLDDKCMVTDAFNTFFFSRTVRYLIGSTILIDQLFSMNLFFYVLIESEALCLTLQAFSSLLFLIV